ncbi:hypothetical protein [Streptomyces cinereoruber]|uniref:hypothetical protein n=1 Tax=Streptomyces cinereoruber TaxID=67260 RepID=UPI0036386A8B
MGAIEIEVGPLACKWCKRPVPQRRWWRRRRYCNGWHRVKKWVARIFEFVGEILSS